MKRKSLFVLLVLFALPLFSNVFGHNQATPEGDNSCTVIVKYSNGSPAEGIKISTDVCGGVSCVGGKNFYTDEDGQVTVTWSEGCNLCYIYVKGTAHKGNYEDGETYTFTL